MRNKKPYVVAYMVCVCLAVILMAIPYGGIARHRVGPDMPVEISYYSYFDPMHILSFHCVCAYLTVIALYLTILWGMEPDSVVKSCVLAVVSILAVVGSFIPHLLGDATNLGFFVIGLLFICACCRIWMLIKCIRVNCLQAK